jgi:hypothetical protein
MKGVTRLALPTVGIGLLSLAVPPAQAAALIVVPAFITNFWQMISGPGAVSMAGMPTAFTAGMVASIRAIMGMAIPRIVTTATDWVQLAHPRVPPSLPALQQASAPLERQASGIRNGFSAHT